MNLLRSVSLYALSLFWIVSVPGMAQEPVVPAGFTRTELKEIQATILKPDGWHVMHIPRKSSEQPLGYQITQEDNEKLGGFKTGLTINVFEKIPEQHSVKPSAFAAALMKRYLAKGEPLSFKSGIKSGPFEMTRLRMKRTMPLLGVETECMIVFTTLANDETGTCYVFIFGTPASEWEAGEKILTTLSQVDLDDKR